MFVRTENGELVYFRSDNIEVPHLFTTRRGGVSTQPHLASLNVGDNRGDSEENVTANLDIAAGQIGLTHSDTVRARQIHSVKVRTVGKADKGAFFEDCDGFVTAEQGVALTVKVADCVPILLCDKQASVIGALHAGWRGAASGIAYEGVLAMTALGAEPSRIKAALGACIHSCCYEVGGDFVESVEALLGCDPEQSGVIIPSADGKYHADIVRLNLIHLERAGIAPENISVCGECTCCDPKLFFSHRYSKGKRGTMCAMIAL